MKHFQAIAAMAENRVIGDGNKIPWHLPEDFKWFKKKTVGNVVVMGRRTYESIGKPLPNRANLILTRHRKKFMQGHPELAEVCKEWRGGSHLKRPYQFRLGKLENKTDAGIFVFNSLEKLNPEEFRTEVFICGGAQIYEQALPRCSDLFLTLVKRTVAGDTFFPPFEEHFQAVDEVVDCAEFKIIHYRHRGLL